MLVDVPLGKAVEDLKDYILWIARQHSEPPAVREGLITWAKDWQQDFRANLPAAEIIVDAMARTPCTSSRRAHRLASCQRYTMI